MRRSPALALAALVSLSACEEPGPDIDPFPIPASRVGGALRVGFQAGVDAEVLALVDTNTPLTVLDRIHEEPKRRRMDVAILSACRGENPLDGCDNVPRARYHDVPVLETHPCRVVGSDCRVGLEPECSSTPGPNTAGYGAILGADLLSTTALRLDLRDDDAPALRLFPDIAGEREFYCQTGVAVLGTPLAGGATIAIEGGAAVYAANRIPINACADYADDTSAASGAALLLLLSTGIGPTVISESAYDRYEQAISVTCNTTEQFCPPPYTELPAQCLQLPSGPTVARVATFSRLAMTGSTARARGPCEERRAARIMYTEKECASADGCPCPNNERTCVADAAVELTPDAGITVAVLPDAHPLLQGLREELRPGLAEIDGLLGLDALHALTLDIDYPGARLLVDCEEPEADAPRQCVAYTETRNVADDADPTPAERCL